MGGGATIVVQVSLDWSGPEHFEQSRPMPCRICGNFTRARDGQGVACHLSCAEDEITRELVAYGYDLVEGRIRITDERAPAGGVR